GSEGRRQGRTIPADHAAPLTRQREISAAQGKKARQRKISGSSSSLYFLHERIVNQPTVAGGLPSRMHLCSALFECNEKAARIHRTGATAQNSAPAAIDCAGQCVEGCLPANPARRGQ